MTLFKNKAGGLSFISSGFNIGGGISSGFQKVTNWFKPVYDKVLEPGYNNVIKPIGEKAVGIVTHTIDRVDRLADASVKATEGAANFLNSNTFTYGMIAIAAVVTLSILKK